MRKAIAPLTILVLAGALNVCSVRADSKGGFPGKGSYTAWMNASVFFKNGIEWANGGNMAKAADSFQKAAATYPHDSVFYYNLAIAQTALGQGQEAEENFRQAVRLEKDYFQAWYNLGSLLYKQQRFDEALNAWKHAARLKHITPAERDSVEKMIAGLESRLQETEPAGKENKRTKKEKKKKQSKKSQPKFD